MTTTKSTDNKGRIQLGARYANRTFIVEEVNETELRLTEAAIIPKRELWLHENLAAKTAIARGIEQAQAGKFAEAPDLEADARLVDERNE